MDKIGTAAFGKNENKANEMKNYINDYNDNDHEGYHEN
jgi:hypothetical protein